jgi:hypothetical protein
MSMISRCFWIAGEADTLGRRNANELDRHFGLPNPQSAS